MIINQLRKDEFGEQLSKIVFPSHPISSIEYLKGRDVELEIIDRALYQSGRHIFIYGDRGVGKSSLAATAAYQYQSVDAEPIFVSGSIDDTFKTIIANIANQALGKSRIETRKHHEKIGFSWRGLSLDAGVEISAIDLFSAIQSVGDATELLKEPLNN